MFNNPANQAIINKIRIDAPGDTPLSQGQAISIFLNNQAKKQNMGISAFRSTYAVKAKEAMDAMQTKNGVPPATLDLYNKIQHDSITLEQAEEIAKHRKASPPDSVASKNVANVADNVNVNVNVNNIEERKVNFANSLKPYLSIYGKDMLNDFYGYWTQHGEKDKKFLAEKQKSFGIERRLETWKRNESKFGFKQQKTEKL
jgi:hypothetical protein